MTDSLHIRPGLAIPVSEIELRTSRSSGPGGQHANVTASRVEAVFDVAASGALSDAQKARISAEARAARDGGGRRTRAPRRATASWRCSGWRSGSRDALRGAAATAHGDPADGGRASAGGWTQSGAAAISSARGGDLGD